MKTLRCIIVDDEPLAVRLLEGFVERTPFLSLAGSFLSATEALTALTPEIDLVFLDINMPELNGLELAALIPSSIRVIFTTAYREYAVESYSVHAADYLLKPVSYPRFLTAVQRLCAPSAPERTEDERDYLFVKSDGRMVRVDMPDILYVKGLKDYACIYTATSERPLIALSTLKAIEERLPASRFCRVHKSFIVNMARVAALEKGKIIVGNEAITLTDAYRERFLSLMR